MITQTIKYEDYDGNEVTEDFYFNLTKLEVMEMEIRHEGGLSNYIEKLTKTTAGVEAYDLFKTIILSSCGKKSDDGRRFLKSPEITADFEQSPALGELIFGFLEDGNSAAEFIRGLLPAKLVKDVEEEARRNGTTITELPTAAPVTVDEEPTDEELLKMKPQEMSTEQLRRAFELKSKA